MTQTPPGWYADPNVEKSERYWDGQKWGEERRHAVTAVGVDQRIISLARPLRKRTQALETISIVFGVFAIIGGVAIALTSSTDLPTRVGRGRRGNDWARPGNVPVGDRENDAFVRGSHRFPTWRRHLDATNRPNRFRPGRLTPLHEM